MDNENNSRGPSRIGIATTLALSLPVLYVLSFGPVMAFSFIKSSSFEDKGVEGLFAQAKSEKQFRRAYLPLIRTADAIGAEPALWKYVSLFGLADRHSLLRQRALAMTERAHDALIDGDLEKARSFANRAEGIDCWYGLLDDTPDRIFFLLQRAEDPKRAL